ncbi:MAG TPA: hypothetical protein VGP93_12125 [Polyangiaceae bacterium]|jgi:hypothetical protein|nr:hypothetical protein [Polyangiaceae bacterium]
MANKFAQFLQDNKIDPRRLILVSSGIEKLRPEDRRIKLTKRLVKSGKATAPEGDGEKAAAAKRRSGRPVTDRLIAAASAGKPVSGPAKTRLLRALNRVLELKKKSAIELKAIF